VYIRDYIIIIYKYQAVNIGIDIIILCFWRAISGSFFGAITSLSEESKLKIRINENLIFYSPLIFSFF